MSDRPCRWSRSSACSTTISSTSGLASPTGRSVTAAFLSKGHGCLALYAVLADRGFFPLGELDRFCAGDGILGGHPEHGMVPGIEASTGALGHGLPIGVGMALASRIQGAERRVIVVLGDGEMDEGSVWEAAMSAGKHGLDTLTAINRLQQDPVLRAGLIRCSPWNPLVDKLRAFGFAVAEVDGHDIAALRRVLGRLPLEPGQPSAVVCHTVKGRGIPDAENNPAWHHRARLSDAELAAIRDALGGE